MQEIIERSLTEEQRMMRDTIREFVDREVLRDASLFLHRDATVDISRFKIVKALFPQTAGAYAGPED